MNTDHGDDAHEYVRLTADVILIGRDATGPHVLMIERAWDPYRGRLALPGGHVDPAEDVEVAARRELEEETTLPAPSWLNLLGVYSAPGRDPRGRYVTWAYLAVLDGLPTPTAADDALTAGWYPLGGLLNEPDRIAFDHHQILTDAAVFADRDQPRPSRFHPFPVGT